MWAGSLSGLSRQLPKTLSLEARIRGGAEPLMSLTEEAFYPVD
ncbi:hypothetical protein [Halomonas sp. NCCP-2165]|nr:hypothetical protein [Halomonas sp. NCCP-2165]GKW49498.1 hypothetical protein NCCP2165_17130 [Halomonas sp. NCCP-2165]